MSPKKITWKNKEPVRHKEINNRQLKIEQNMLTCS